MTYDDLTSKIQVFLVATELQSVEDFEGTKMLKALRAVVELHMSSPEGRYDNPICVECSFTETGHYVLYPCRNIQAIEKEL
jgi:hypothetical protein